ncbi:hypothetical protein F4810DRAFT_689798 [Camillea tinctor]|nr:hypothetical protein F4810DRAFT_689798 [Camillea tinctor]
MSPLTPVSASSAQFPPPQAFYQPAQSPTDQDEDGREEEDPPCLTNMSTSIFVPATIDFSQPVPPLPSDPQERERLALAQIDEHAAAVRRNIHHLLAQETTRSRRVGARARPPYGRPAIPERVPGLTAAQEAAALPTEEHSQKLRGILNKVKDAVAPARGAEVPPVTLESLVSEVVYEEQVAPRRYAVMYFLNTVRNGLMQLDGHAASVEKVKNEKREEIRSEMLRGVQEKANSWAAAAEDGGSSSDVGVTGGNDTTAVDEGDKMDTS